MHYVYVLKSLHNGDFYVGFSSDLRERFASHNNGKVKSTKAYRPWKLVYYEAYCDSRDARKRELQLKEHKPKSDLLKQINHSAEKDT